MKILMLTDRMEAGGVETHIAQLTRGLADLGMECAVLSGGGALAEELAQQGIPQIYFPLPHHSPLLLWRLRKKLERLVKQEGFSILHAHTRITAELIRGFDKKGVGEIVTAHAMFRSSPFLRRLSYWGRHTITVSEDLRCYLDRGRPP